MIYVCFFFLALCLLNFVALQCVAFGLLAGASVPALVAMAVGTFVAAAVTSPD